MCLKIVLIFSLVIIGILHRCDGQFTCLVGDITANSVWRTVPGSVGTNTCSGGSGLPDVRTCNGGPSQFYVQCYCTDVNNASPPGTDCWKAGEKLTTSDGFCNSDISSPIAVATFDSGGSFVHFHIGAFIGCKNPTTIQLYGQKCGQSLGNYTIVKGDPIFDLLHVVTTTVNTIITNTVDCIPVPKETCYIKTDLEWC